MTYRTALLGLIGFTAVFSSSICMTNDDPLRLEGVVIEKEISLDRAFEQAKAVGREFALVERELTRMLMSSNDDDRRVALGWVTRIDDRFTVDEQYRLISYCKAILPLDYPADLVEPLVRLRWKQSTQDERRKIYWDAVKSGKARIWEGRELDRSTALVMAAGEGLEEFADAIKQYEQGTGGKRTMSDIRTADKLLWYLRLRAGARDTKDADRLQGQRLTEMGDGEFARLMKEDSTFAQVTLTFAGSVCEQPASEACRSVGAVALRQETLWHEANKNDAGRISAVPLQASKKPEWLEDFGKAAGPGKVEIRLDEGKARRRSEGR
jgi:hypothetical protein